MDDILRRMLEVEREAEKIVAEGDTEAAAASAQGRSQVTSLQNSYREENAALVAT